MGRGGVKLVDVAPRVQEQTTRFPASSGRSKATGTTSTRPPLLFACLPATGTIRQATARLRRTVLRGRVACFSFLCGGWTWPIHGGGRWVHSAPATTAPTAPAPRPTPWLAARRPATALVSRDRVWGWPGASASCSSLLGHGDGGSAHALRRRGPSGAQGLEIGVREGGRVHGGEAGAAGQIQV